MLYGQRLKELENTERLLIMQADVHRNLLRLESAALRDRLKRSVLGQGWLGSNPWLALGALAGGFLAFRRWRDSARWVPVVVTVWRWVRAWFHK